MSRSHHRWSPTLTPQRWLFLSLVLLVAAAAWTIVSAPSDADLSRQLLAAPQRGFAAPDFTLQTSDGDSVRLSDLRGRPVVINLWASWCAPCRAEMPALEAVYQEYRNRGLVVLAVNATNQDSPAAAVRFAEDHQLSFPILLDIEGEASRAYQLRALPSTFFIDADGIIREVVVGGPMAEALLRTRIDRLMDGTS